MSNEESTRDGAAVRFPPPLVPVIALAAGFVLAWLLGPLPNPIAGLGRYSLGGLLFVIGLGLIIVAGGIFRRSGQNPAPWTSTPEVVSSGIYGWTRNPMYLGMGLIQAGLGLLFANLWIVALVPVSWIVIYRIAIRHEEAYLEEKFGAAYLDYKQSVRRWL